MLGCLPRICGHQRLRDLSINPQKLTQLLNVAQHYIHLLASCDTAMFMDFSKN